MVQQFETLCIENEGSNPYALFAEKQNIPLRPEPKPEKAPPRVPRKKPEARNNQDNIQELLRRAANGDLNSAERLSALQEDKASDQSRRPRDRRLQVKSALPPPPPPPLPSEYQLEKPDVKKHVAQRFQQFVQLDVAYRIAGELATFLSRSFELG